MTSLRRFNQPRITFDESSGPLSDYIAGYQSTSHTLWLFVTRLRDIDMDTFRLALTAATSYRLHLTIDNWGLDILTIVNIKSA